MNRVRWTEDGDHTLSMFDNLKFTAVAYDRHTVQHSYGMAQREILKKRKANAANSTEKKTKEKKVSKKDYTTKAEKSQWNWTVGCRRCYQAHLRPSNVTATFRELLIGPKRRIRRCHHMIYIPFMLIAGVSVIEVDSFDCNQ